VVIDGGKPSSVCFCFFSNNDSPSQALRQYPQARGRKKSVIYQGSLLKAEKTRHSILRAEWFGHAITQLYRQSQGKESAGAVMS
jgi:hypothetical protein